MVPPLHLHPPHNVVSISAFDVPHIFNLDLLLIYNAAESLADALTVSLPEHLTSAWSRPAE